MEQHIPVLTGASLLENAQLGPTLRGALFRQLGGGHASCDHGHAPEGFHQRTDCLQQWTGHGADCRYTFFLPPLQALRNRYVFLTPCKAVLWCLLVMVTGAFFVTIHDIHPVRVIGAFRQESHHHRSGHIHCPSTSDATIPVLWFLLISHRGWKLLPDELHDSHRHTCLRPRK